MRVRAGDPILNWILGFAPVTSYLLNWIIIYIFLSDHCMIQFVKPNLLGTSKEFRNRFANPIEQGQCVEAMPRDVRRMKRRAHILHNMLEGCVQVRDLITKCTMYMHWHCWEFKLRDERMFEFLEFWVILSVSILKPLKVIMILHIFTW